MIIRSVMLPDLKRVQHLILDSFAAELHPYMTATQAGAEAFLGVYVEYSSLFPERSYLLAQTLDGELLGYAEFRVHEGHIGFLVYICVTPAARGQGVATRLIQDYLGGRPEVDVMQLDVFSHNVPAINLYRKLGFIEETQTVWWLLPLKPIEQAGPGAQTTLLIENLPAALAMHERYGFCELQGRYQSQSLRLGRMGQGVLRCFNLEDFQNAALHSAVQAIFPELREVLLILPAAQMFKSADAREINRSVRMHWQITRALLEDR